MHGRMVERPVKVMDGNLAADLARPVIDLGVWFVGGILSITQHAIANFIMKI